MTVFSSGPEQRQHAIGQPLHSQAVERLEAMIEEQERAAERVMDTPVTGPRGQQMPLADAAAKAAEISNRIDLDEARGSLRHRTTGRPVKVLTLAFLTLIDFPVMLWLTASVFNVDWSAPLGLPLAISLGISLLGTAGAAWTLYHLGHNRRESKNDRRQLDLADMSAGAMSSLVGIGLLIALIAVVMFVRVYTEGALSGLDDLALLLAILVAFIMLLSAALVFGTSFRDGSPQQDDLAHYSRLVYDGLQRRRDHEDCAARLRHERDMLRRSAHGSTGEGVGDGHAPAAATDDTYAPTTTDAAEARGTVDPCVSIEPSRIAEFPERFAGVRLPPRGNPGAPRPQDAKPAERLRHNPGQHDTVAAPAPAGRRAAPYPCTDRDGRVT